MSGTQSIYQKAKPTDYKKIITEHLLYKINYANACSLTADVSNKEKSHDQIKMAINLQNGKDILDMIQELENADGNEENKEQFMEKFYVKKCSGTVKLDKYNISVKFKMDEEGIVTFNTVMDLNTYKYTGTKFESTLSYNDPTHCIEFYKALSKAYPRMSTSRVMCLDIERISSYSDCLTIGDVAEIMRWLATAGWIIPIDNLMNTKNTAYLQMVYITSYIEIPVVTEMGQRIVDYYSAKLGLINGTSYPDTEYETPYWIFSTPKTKSLVLTLSNGITGFLCNGEFIGIEEKEGLSDTFEIVSVLNKRKFGRFKDFYPAKKQLHEGYVCQYFKNSNSNIASNALENCFAPTNELELIMGIREYLTRHKIANVNSGIFDNIDKVSETGKMYFADTTWGEFNTPYFFGNESQEARFKRTNECSRIVQRLSMSFHIKGLSSYKRAREKSGSPIYRIGFADDGSMPRFNRAIMDSLPVQVITEIDRLYTFEKSLQVFQNDTLNENNRGVKMEIDKFFTANSGKKINIKDIGDEVTYINAEIDRRIKSAFSNLTSKNRMYKKANITDDDVIECMKEYKGILKTSNIMEKCELATKLMEKTTKLGFTYKTINFENYLPILKQNYGECLRVYNNVLYLIRRYRNINTLPFRVKEKISRIAEEYNRVTGKVLKIQGFKIETIAVIDNAVEELKEIEDKDLKKTAKQLISSSKKLRRACKKNLYKSTDYGDINNICEDIIRLGNNLIQNEYESNILNKLLASVDKIINNEYAIEEGESYSKDYFKINNLIFQSTDCAYLTMYC